METAVLLAAGRGTRMGALTATMPKPLLRVGGVPIIERILRGLAGAGIRHAVIVTGYLGEQIEAFLGDGSRLGVAIEYRRQERPEGTARALQLARTAIGAETFLLGWGDILVPAEFYGEFIRSFESQPCEVQLAVNRVDDPWQGAAVYVDDAWRVTRLDEKPPRGTARTKWNNAGVFIFTSAVFRYAERLPASARGEYELPQAVAQMVARGCSVRAVPIRGFWSDVGTPEDLTRTEAELRNQESGVSGQESEVRTQESGGRGEG